MLVAGCAREDASTTWAEPAAETRPVSEAPPLENMPTGTDATEPDVAYDEPTSDPLATTTLVPVAPPPLAPARQPVPEPLAEAEIEYLAMDALLRMPAPGEPTPRSLKWDRDPPDAVPVVVRTPNAVDRVKERLRIERRSQPLGPAGPRQGKHSETDAGVTVPLGDDIRLEGGVRIDDREEPARERERTSQPRVGVEVRF